jgi:hypothetical protein
MSKQAQTYKKKAISTLKKGKETTISVAKKGATIVANNPVKTGYVLGAVLGVYLLYKVVTKTTDKIDTLLDGDPNIDDTIGNTGQGNTNNATITNAQAVNFAQQLLDAMNYMFPFYGTDEATIEAVFNKLQNSADFLKVYHAFGEKDYNGNNSPPTGFWSNLDSYKKQNLVYWLKSELNSVLDREIYNKVKNIVELAGFTF